MAQLPRKTQKIFGGNSSNNGQPGSARAGTFLLSNDLATLQALSAWQNGWFDITLSGEYLPALEEMQAIDYVITSQLAYIFEQGIPEWDAGTTYYENSIVKKAGTYELYGSLVDNNTNNALTDGTKWVLLINLENGGNPLNNYTATTDPTVNDDESDGYSFGSIWYNTSAQEAYMCVNPANGAAVWILTTLTADDLGSAAFQNTSAFATAAQGTKADAALPYGLMSDSIIGRVGFSLKISNNASDATNDIDVASGSCVSDDGTTIMTLGAGITKQLDAAWAVGTNQGGRDTGSISDNTWHVWVINRPDTNVTDVLLSLSPSSPTMPANYTKKKRIGSIVRASSSIRGFVQYGSEFYYKTVPAAATQGATGTSAFTMTTAVPTGVQMLGIFNLHCSDNAGAYLSSLDVTDQAAATSAPLAHGGVTAANGGFGNARVMTNTSAQIRARTSGNMTTFSLATIGWKDISLG